MQAKFQMLQNVVTGDVTIYTLGGGVWHKIGVVPRLKWKAVDEMRSAIIDLCNGNVDWENVKRSCQSLIDAAPCVPAGDISAQVFDPLKLLRAGSKAGDILKRAAEGDHSAIAQFISAVAREEIIRTYGSHIIRFTSVAGEGLGTGILLLLRDNTCAILTCSHVWSYLVKHAQVQMFCASNYGGIVLHQKMMQIDVDQLSVVDMAERDFMERAGVDAFLFKRDSAIIAGDLEGLFPLGARAFDLREAGKLEPENENYALVGYPLAANGELGAQNLEYASPTRNNHVFTRHPRDQSAGSLNGASGGLVVAVRHGRYRPVALMVEEQGSVEESSVNSCPRPTNPSAFHAFPLVDLRTMVETAGKLLFRNREGRVVREC